MQLSPPFQFPQPVGAIARLSDGIEVGIIGGNELGETVPVTMLAAVVVVAPEVLVVAVVVVAPEILVVADVDVETCVVLEAAVVEVATEVT